MTAIAVLTATPNQELLEFYSGFVQLGYRVFVFIDDNTFKFGPAELKAKNIGVSLIQIDDRVCSKAGFFDLNPIIKKSSGCSAWEKALYYFCCNDLADENIWFIEDDVFVPNHEAIAKIDSKYTKADIVSAANIVNETGAHAGWFWWRFIPKKFPPPWAKSDVCVVRLSRQLLVALETLIRSSRHNLHLQKVLYDLVGFVKKRKSQIPRKFFFIEFTFHTLALHNGLKVVTPYELSGVVWHKDWNVAKMNSETIYHPLKDRDAHSQYRTILNGRSGKSA